MKKCLSLLLGAALLAGICCAGALGPARAQGAGVKILAIGNSFSEDAMEWLYQIFEDAGYADITLGYLYMGGQSLAGHWDQAKNDKSGYDYRKKTPAAHGSWSHRESTMEYGLKDEAWDVITLQQASGYSGLPVTYNADLDNLVGYILSRKTNPDARLGWHMTWAYQADSSHADFPRYGSDQMTMYNAIVAAVREKIVPNDAFDFVIPAGTAIQNMRTSYVGDTLTRDGYHLSQMGRYLAGLAWYKAITGGELEGLRWRPPAVPKRMLPMLREAAGSAVAAPFEVTASSYAQAPCGFVAFFYKIWDWLVVQYYAVRSFFGVQTP